MAGFVLDTTAVMAVLLREDGAEQVLDVLRDEAGVFLPFIVMMEMEYRLLRVGSEEVERALALVDSWPAVTVESNRDWRRVAARIKAQGKLSLADAWVAALALIEDAELVHKDPEFDAVQGLKALRLPYDRNRGTL